MYWFLMQSIEPSLSPLHKIQSIIMFLLFLLQTTIAANQGYLNNIPITFELQGSTNYVPSTGGVAIPGYTIHLGFDRYQWLGIMFMDLTSTNNYDVLIVQRSTTQSSGVYTCTVSDYYVSSGRNDTLMSDTMTSNDLTSTTMSNSSSFSLTFPRTVGNTNGQDWQVSQFAKVCFFTSEAVFTQSTWSQQNKVCYGFEVNNYVSTFRGVSLGTMMFEGVNSLVYGGIYGPFYNFQLFWFRNSLTMSNTSNIIVRIGNQINEDLGYDYFVCGVGDYYGTDHTQLNRDLSYSGYNNGACTYTTTTQSVKLTYSRDIYTFDSFDAEVGKSISICLIGTQNHCGSFTLSINDPSMTVSSAISIHQPHLVFLSTLTLILLSILILS